MELRLENWTKDDFANLVELLKSEADLKYREFHSSLVPDNDKSVFIGIRVPRLREISKEIAKGNPRSFLESAADEYYEIRMLKAYVIGLIKTQDFNDFASLFDSFVPSVDSWAVCDGFCCSVKEVKKYKADFFQYIQKYLDSKNEWAIRVAVVIMLNYYLDDDYIDCVLKRCDRINNKAYYVSVAQAWLLATAVAKCREKTLSYLRSNSLDDITFNRTVQKCVESRRIDDGTKNYLRSLKRREQ